MVEKTGWFARVCDLKGTYVILLGGLQYFCSFNLTVFWSFTTYHDLTTLLVATPRWKSSKPVIDWVNTVPGTRTNFSGSKNMTGFSWQATEKTIFRRRKKHLLLEKWFKSHAQIIPCYCSWMDVWSLPCFFCELRRGHSVREIAMITSNVLVKNQLSQLKMVVVSNVKLVKSIDIYICVCVRMHL